MKSPGNFGREFFNFSKFQASLVFIALISTVASGQTLTLKRAVELALRHSTAMGMATADEQRAMQAYREAHGAYIPQLIIGSGLAYAYGFPLSLEGSAPTIFNLNSQSTLLNPSQRQFVRAAKADWHASTSQTKEQRSQVILDTSISYAELDKWQKKFDVLQHELEISQKMEQATNERVKEGIDSPVDETKARLAAAEAKLHIAEAQGAADMLRSHLAQLTGLPEHDITTDSGSVPEMPHFDVEEDVGERATSNSYAVQAADERARGEELKALGEHRALLPSIDLALQYGLISTSFTNFEQFFQPGSFQRNNTTLGLVVKFPFFSASQKARAQGADAEAVHARREAQSVRDQVSSEALKLHGAVQQASAAEEVAQLQYDLAKANQGVAQERTHAGVATLRELQDANVQANERSGQALDAHFELMRAQLQLMRSLGTLESWATSSH
jgi:outer membrane protein TolC